MSVPHSDPVKQNRHVGVRASSSTPSASTPSASTSSFPVSVVSRVSVVSFVVVPAPAAPSTPSLLDLDLDLDPSLATSSRVSLRAFHLASFDDRSRASSVPSSSSSSSASASSSDDDDDDESDDASRPPASPRRRLPSSFARRRRSKSASPLRITGELIPLARVRIRRRRRASSSASQWCRPSPRRAVSVGSGRRDDRLDRSGRASTARGDAGEGGGPRVTPVRPDADRMDSDGFGWIRMDGMMRSIAGERDGRGRVDRERTRRPIDRARGRDDGDGGDGDGWWRRGCEGMGTCGTGTCTKTGT